jgi:hypothetical protein
MGNSRSEFGQYESETINLKRKKKEKKSHSKIIDDINFTLILEDFSFFSKKASYQIIIENLKDEKVILKEIIYNKNIPWWRNFCLKIILPTSSNDTVSTITDEYHDFARIQNTFEKEDLESYKHLALLPQQRLVSEIILTRFSYPINESLDSHKLIQSIPDYEKIYFIAEYYKIDLSILEGLEYEKFGYKVWKNKNPIFGTQIIEYINNKHLLNSSDE